MVLDELTGRDFFKDPGLNRTLAGDGAASLFAGLVGAPAMTSYGENIGVMAITKIHSVYVLMGAAMFAILFAFVNKLNVLIMQMPMPVIGGISFLCLEQLRQPEFRLWWKIRLTWVSSET